jgi:acyl-CoA thioesterase FadM
MAMIETYRGVVSPWLADQMGHLTTSKYVEMFDVASYHLMHALGDRPATDRTMGWADVRHTIDYKAEVGVGALVLIRSGVLKTGRTSFSARHVMTDPDGEVLHAVLEAATVRFDLVARKASPLPEGFAGRAAGLMIEDAA